jgi:hypothetical protein
MVPSWQHGPRKIDAGDFSQKKALGECKGTLLISWNNFRQFSWLVRRPGVSPTSQQRSFLHSLSPLDDDHGSVVAARAAAKIDAGDFSQKKVLEEIETSLVS